MPQNKLILRASLCLCALLSLCFSLSACQEKTAPNENQEEYIDPEATVTSDSQTEKVTLPYERVYHQTDTLLLGEEKVQVAGQDGYHIYQIDRVYQDGVLTQETRTDIERQEPVTEVILQGTRPDTKATGTFRYPIRSAVTSYYGWRTLNGTKEFHLGIDLRASVGTKIFASDGGKVAFAGTLGGINASYGNLLIIDHENGYRTYYAHLSSFAVKAGDRVYQGQTVGRAGVTGYVTGPHLHFEIRKDGQTQNPLNYLI